MILFLSAFQQSSFVSFVGVRGRTGIIESRRKHACMYSFLFFQQLEYRASIYITVPRVFSIVLWFRPQRIWSLACFTMSSFHHFEILYVSSLNHLNVVQYLIRISSLSFTLPFVVILRTHHFYGSLCWTSLSVSMWRMGGAWFKSIYALTE